MEFSKALRPPPAPSGEARGGGGGGGGGQEDEASNRGAGGRSDRAPTGETESYKTPFHLKGLINTTWTPVANFGPLKLGHYKILLPIQSSYVWIRRREDPIEVLEVSWRIIIFDRCP